MKIKEVNTNYILFDNGSRITFDHEQDCCETIMQILSSSKIWH